MVSIHLSGLRWLPAGIALAALFAGCGPSAAPAVMLDAPGASVQVDGGAADAALPDVPVVIDASIVDVGAGDAGACDGLNAEGCACQTVGATRVCYTGPAGSENRGQCHDGVQTCATDGEFAYWGPCTGDQGPTAEMCGSDQDYNCNGFVGCADPMCVTATGCCAAGATRACYDGPAGTAGVGICTAGQQTCTPQGAWPADCPGEVVPGVESGHCSDGLDNDCNGLADCADPACATTGDCCAPGATRPCYDGPAGTAGVGVCAAGLQTCSAQGTWPMGCAGELLPGNESANCGDGLDNDCNGLVDCLDPACSALPTCCLPGTTRDCYDGPAGTEGIGVCAGGQQACSAQGIWPMACAGETVPGMEAGHCSDGLDNDCNGQVDCLDPACSAAGACCVPGAIRTCYDGPASTENVGVCVGGEQVCTQQGTWPAVCSGEVVPGSEANHCDDGLDNDCNGEVDCLDPACAGTAGCCPPGAMRSCYDGPAGTAGVGVCEAGTQMCSAQGTWPAVCDGEILPGSESGQCSDGLDNDCNGEVDCLDAACAGTPGCCVPGATRSCYGGPTGTAGVGICQAGTQICAADGTWPASCPGEVDPGVEVGNCTDDLDNDCNGLSDCQDPACASDPTCCIPVAGGATGPVAVTITADNAYSFGYGDANSIPTAGFVQGQGSTLAGQIFNCYNSMNPGGDVGPEVYTVSAGEAPPGTYLYIIAWCDSATTQGVLGQFKRSAATIYTGDSRFQVCATGLNYPGGGTGPALDTINAEITACNATTANATISKGWVDAGGAVTAGAVGTLAVGEDNADDGVGVYPPVCPAPPNPGPSNTINNSIDTAAQWMWYCPTGTCAGYSAFEASNTAAVGAAFLIFRLPAAQIGCEPP